MPVGEALLVVLAGVGAGTINTIVGSGTLITFPTLLLLGVPPVTANISNNLGLVPGSLTGSIGYRRELRGMGAELRRYVPISFVGGAAGAVLLLVLDPDLFRAIVPVLIVLGVALVVLGPRINAWATRRREAAGQEAREHRGAMRAGVLGAGVYGGYFGAAQGIILMGVLGALSGESLQRLNGLKNVLATVVNAIAAVVFLAVASDRIDWLVVLLIAVGSTLGGVLGATVGRRLPSPVLRGIIVVVGVVAVTRLVL
ncbi:sulfite exporter TauE/SafE family protein [Phycicoccus sp. CSK15P-2]|uniref:sulfite exporter TauE/SafE family protein n=1 Tax=Phycicoccus sp. CSK15P-2 TaxID=2807627 RepID=UPI0019521A84|nr:sulfite exporter TauE/SafE family protein [Phycicoccus sp. CSK15P-2]MBM6403883.1 sulfite exporter TauE/SafE family protein [Phycicoccus sp. CSK15P-2]